MDRDAFLREIGIELLSARGKFNVLCHDQVSAPLVIEPHHHDEVLQFDLVRGCSGQVFSEGRWLQFEGPISLVAYPGQTHGYTLEPVEPDVVVYNFKLTTGQQLPSQPFPPFATVSHDSLFAAAARVVSTASSSMYPGIPGILALLELLVSWPQRGGMMIRREAGQVVDPLIEQAVSYIEARLSNPPGLNETGRHVGVSGRQLSRLFIRATGMSPYQYTTARRLDRARVLLLSSDASILEVAFSLGFSSHATFTRWFSQLTGMTPSEFRSSPSVF